MSFWNAARGAGFWAIPKPGRCVTSRPRSLGQGFPALTLTFQTNPESDEYTRIPS